MKTSEDLASWNNMVVDPTGAGNAFLGGCAIGLLANGLSMNMSCFERAAVYGSVAASFAVEQVGMPKLLQGKDGLGEEEQWNNEFVSERLKSYDRVS